MSPQIHSRFSFGPWNISEGADPFGPPVREALPHEEKFVRYKPLGFCGVQFHDDEVVPGLDNLQPVKISAQAAKVSAMLNNIRV